MRKTRYNYSLQEKVFILKRHLVDHVAVSDLACAALVTPLLGLKRPFLPSKRWF